MGKLTAIILLCIFPTFHFALAFNPGANLKNITEKLNEEIEVAKEKADAMEAHLKAKIEDAKEDFNAKSSGVRKEIEDAKKEIEEAKESLLAKVLDDEPSAGEWLAFLQTLGGAKGMGALGIVALSVQGLLLLARSRFSRLTGKNKFLTVSGLTMATGVTGLMLAGFDLPSAMTHSTTLAAVQVYAHQFRKEIFEGDIA